MDAMRPATCINGPLERNRKESAQFREVKNTAKKEGKVGRERRNSEGGERGINTWTSMRGRCLLFLFSHFQHTV